MTPGWANVRNNLAESHHQRPRGLPSMRAWVAIVLVLLSILLWLGLAAGAVFVRFP